MTMFMKVYTWLDHQLCDVSNAKRFFAYVIDWFAGSLCTMLPMCLLWMFWTQDMDRMANANVLLIAGQVSDAQAYLAGALSILFALFYYVYIPWRVTPGQTPGKRAMGFAIVKEDGSAVTLRALLIRQIIGIMVVEGALYNVSGIWHSMLSLALDVNLVTILMYVGLAISVLSGFLVLRVQSRRMLHDYLARTKVTAIHEETSKNESI